jgi:transposase
MQVEYQRCAGIDLHKKTAVTTIISTQPDGTVETQTRTFSTMTSDLLALDDWLRAHHVEIVAMEATGIYWRPVFNILEEGREIMLVNAQHMKAVPGKKTDVKDSQWIADLLRHGLLSASFIPPVPIRQLRDLTRYRKMLVQERAQEINRLQKVLETANIKLAAVATDVLGKSGRDMLNCVIAGERDAEALAELARGRLRAKLPDLRLALEGRVEAHHQFLLQQILAHTDFLEQSIDAVQHEIDKRLVPYQEAVTLIQSLPVQLQAGAATVIAEIGVDMSRFPSDAHLASWAGVCPGNCESAGKRKSGKTTDGNRYLRGVLCEMAWIVSRMKDNYLSAFYHRIARRRGKKRAIIAVAHKILVIIYHMLKNNKPYEDLGGDYFDQLDAARIERRAIQRLEQLGYDVALTAREPSDKTIEQPPDKTTKDSANKTAKQLPDKTTKAPANKTAKQPPSKTAKDPANKTAKQPPNKTTKDPVNKPPDKTAKKKEVASLHNV